MKQYENMYMNSEKLLEVPKRNLVRFRQILDDLTDIYNRFEAGKLDGIWFIRRLNAAILGVTWMTDTDGKRYCIGWKDGKLIKTLDELPKINLRAAHKRLCQQHLIGTAPIGKLPSNITARELQKEEGVALQ